MIGCFDFVVVKVQNDLKMTKDVASDNHVVTTRSLENMSVKRGKSYIGGKFWKCEMLKRDLLR